MAHEISLDQTLKVWTCSVYIFGRYIIYLSTHIDTSSRSKTAPLMIALLLLLLAVIRKPVRKTSLFKFMTVLRLEVWLSIVGALTVTGIMIWILDKYSPYSAQNNKSLYPYPCRYNVIYMNTCLV